MPGNAEHGLDEDHVGEQDRDVAADQRERGRQRDRKRVPKRDAPRRQPLRRRGAHEVLAEHLRQGRAHHPQAHRGQRQPGDEPRHEQRSQPLPRIVGQALVRVRGDERDRDRRADVRREQQDHEESDEVDRRAQNDRREGLERSRHERSLLARADQPARDPQGGADHHRPDQQGDVRRQRVGEHVPHREERRPCGSPEIGVQEDAVEVVEQLDDHRSRVVEALRREDVHHQERQRAQRDRDDHD